MVRPRFLLAAGFLVFAVTGLVRFAAETIHRAPRPLQSIARQGVPAAPLAQTVIPVPARTVKKGVSGATVTAAIKPGFRPLAPPKASPPAPPRIVRMKSTAAPSVASVSEVRTPNAAPRVAPSITALDYERRVADAASIGAAEPNRATFRLEHLAAAKPDRPEAYQTLAAIYLRQGDFYQAYEMFDAAIRNGGKATFTIMHDHSRGNFDEGPNATCVGELTIQPTELAFEGADGHRFAASWGELSEAGSNRFFGSRIGGFHVRLTADGKSRNFNLAPHSRDKREANIILDLLIENAQRQDSGK